MRISAVLLLMASLAACNRGPNHEAVRQGVIDHLAKAGLNMPGIEVGVTSVEMVGDQADATVLITPKGGNASQGMSMKYHLRQEGSQWVVTGRAGEASQHGGAALPQGGDPHSGGVAAPGGEGKMPSPQDLPPVKK